LTSYVTRLGKTIEADEAFHAWTSGDLGRMRRALSIPTNLIDRHFLLMGIVQLTYKNRSDPSVRRLCKEVGRQHLAEFDAIAPALRREMRGFLPRVPTFQLLATILAEDGELTDAIAVCERALRWDLRDGTKGGFAARSARLHRKLSPTVRDA